jgi:hypothetical protein
MKLGSFYAASRGSCPEDRHNSLYCLALCDSEKTDGQALAALRMRGGVAGSEQGREWPGELTETIALDSWFCKVHAAAKRATMVERLNRWCFAGVGVPTPIRIKLS